ncbi:hypothetical protein, partial [Pseudomonas chlororaphis]|uniref:hypothetical protein n=1 Tax=Pseudomonas chlororaphis TaxID=587753 RepID=UPI003D0E99B1
MTDIDARLREDVHLLGELLGNTIRVQYGEGFLDKIEQHQHAIDALRHLGRRLQGDLVVLAGHGLEHGEIVEQQR